MTVQPSFASPAAAKAWARYHAELDRLLGLAGLDAGPLAQDLSGRLHAAYLAEPGERELPRLLAAIRKVGTPAEALRLPLAAGLLDRGSRGFRPLVLARGLWHALFTGGRGVVIGGVFALGYATAAALAAVALLKPVMFGGVGLVRDYDGRLRLGRAYEDLGSTELLGWWAVPLGLTLAAALYLVLTLLMRWLRPR